MVQIFKCRILENSRVGQNYFRMIFAAPQIARESRAGQFVHLRCTTSIDPLLRRPFSIHRMDRDKVEILYRVIGRGTAEIAKRKAGEIVDVMGPLGQGFEIPKGGEHSRAILIAGGIGVAPMVMLAEEIKKVRESKCLQCSDVTSEITESFGQRVRVLIGAKTKKELLCEKEFKKSGCEVKVATQDGSKGFKGLVTELLEQSLTTHNAPPARLADCQSLTRGSTRRTTIYACGPKEMLMKVAKITQKYNIPAQVSLEENMACGIGACYGCSVKTKNGYKLVCKDGPVFNADEIVWKDEYQPGS